MVEEISDVADYVINSFIEDFLIDDDKLVIIQFFGKAEILYEGYVDSNNKAELLKMVSDMQADGRFTDIGNALDRLKRSVAAEKNYERRYLILLTDGKQEAPPESPYYTPDGSFNHEFLEHTKVIQRNGWKIMILGVGLDTAVEQLADELGTTHEELDFTGDLPSAKTEDEVLGRIMASDFTVSNYGMTFELKSEGYRSERTVIIEQINYQTINGNYELIEEPLIVKVAELSANRIDLEFSNTKLAAFENTDKNGSILFKFSGDTPFLPAVVDGVYIKGLKNNDNGEEEIKKGTEKDKNDSKSELNWLVLIIIIVAAALIVAFIIIRNIIFHRDDGEEKKHRNEISNNS